MFTNTVAKLSIGSLDTTDLWVEAHYNPKELAQSRTVPWADKQHVGHTALDPEFSGSQPRSMELEMLFDGYEENLSVGDLLQVLEALATVRDETSNDPEMRRPHYCIVTWGENGMKPLRCVIESLTTRVTMMGRDGMPLRAIANIKVREAKLDEYAGAEKVAMAKMRRRMAAAAGEDSHEAAIAARQALLDDLE